MQPRKAGTFLCTIPSFCYIVFLSWLKYSVMMKSVSLCELKRPVDFNINILENEKLLKLNNKNREFLSKSEHSAQSRMNDHRRIEKKANHHGASYRRCPYNRRHYVLDEIYGSHLISCSKKNSQINVIICPYGGSHRCRNVDQMVKILQKFFVQEMKIRRELK